MMGAYQAVYGCLPNCVFNYAGPLLSSECEFSCYQTRLDWLLLPCIFLIQPNWLSYLGRRDVPACCIIYLAQIMSNSSHAWCLSIGVNRPDLGGTVPLLGYSSRCPTLH